MKKILTSIITSTGFMQTVRADSSDYGCLGGWGMMGAGNWGVAGMGFMWFFGLIIWLLIVAALVVFILWMIKQLQEKKGKK